MVNTRYLTTVVEEHVRGALSREYGVQFFKRALPLSTGGLHEFDAVAADGLIIASVKSASGRTAGGKIPSGKIKDCIAELYFLSLVEAPRRVLILTSPKFYDLFVRTMRGKVASGIEVIHLSLPADVQAEVTAVQERASAEVFPVLDRSEQAAAPELET